MGISYETWTALACDIGQRRHNNEDYVLACEPANAATCAQKGYLYIVADGIGGGAAGEVASQFASLFVAHHYYESEGPPSPTLTSSISAANAALHDYSRNHSRLASMGTTIVAAVIHEDMLYVAHVGDSRAYLIRNSGSNRLTEDHNLATQLARDGLIGRSQAGRHPQRHLLLRSLGAESQVVVDHSQVPLRAGDCLFLCSDGLNRHVPEPEIERVVSSYNPPEASRILVETANDRGGQDNISVIITRFGQKPAVPAHGILPEPPSAPDIDQIRLWAQTQARKRPVTSSP